MKGSDLLLTRSKLERASNIGSLLAAVLLVGHIVDLYTGSHVLAAIKSSLTRSKTMIGRTLPPEVGIRPGHRAVVVGLSTNCGYCEREAPKYSVLPSVLTGLPVDLIAAFPAAEENARAYLERHGMRMFTLTAVTLSQIGITHTPTVLVVNSRGAVEKEFVGAGTASSKSIAAAVRELN